MNIHEQTVYRNLNLENTTFLRETVRDKYGETEISEH